MPLPSSARRAAAALAGAGIAGLLAWAAAPGTGPGAPGPAPSTDRPARRIVSLVPALTDVLLELGAGDRLVARTRHDAGPVLDPLPSVGDPTSPSLEVLAAARPDLVIWWTDEASPRTASRLRESGVGVHGARLIDFGDLRRHVRHLGAFTGRARTADSLLDGFDRALTEAAVRVPERRRPAVAVVVWPRPLSVAGPGTFLDRIVRLAGGRNAFADARRAWPRPGPESLVARDPDVLLVPRRDGDVGVPDAFLEGQPWGSLRAVREARVVRLPADLLERPTLESPRAVRVLAARLTSIRDAREGAP